MATKMAAAIGRSLTDSKSTASFLPRRLFSSTRCSSISQCRRLLPSVFPIGRCSSFLSLVRPVFSPGTARFAHRSSESALAKSVRSYFGCDYKHWKIYMVNPGGEGATKQQKIDCFVTTLAKVLGSGEEAKRKIYNVSCDSMNILNSVGCEIDEQTSIIVKALPGVTYIIPDTYVDPENKDYGGELYVNGEIIKRSPEREEKVRALWASNDSDIMDILIDSERLYDTTRYVKRHRALNGEGSVILTRYEKMFESMSNTKIWV